MSYIYTSAMDIMPTNRQTITLLSELVNDRFQRFHPPSWFDFNEEHLRYLYYNLFFTANTFAVRDTWQFLYNKCTDEEIQFFFTQQEQIKIFCFGAGSGHGVVGFSEWLKLLNPNTVTIPLITDKYSWFGQARTYLASLNSGSLSNVDEFLYFETDITNMENMAPHERDVMIHEMTSADALMFVHFFSQIGEAVDLQIYRETITTYIHVANPDIIFFMDYVEHSQEIDQVAVLADLELIARVDDIVIEIPDEEKDEMYVNNFNGILPRFESRVCASLWVWRNFEV